jgi:hypothetical protein
MRFRQGMSNKELIGELSKEMSPAVHYRYNIVNAAEMLVKHPLDRDIIILAYEAHKEILRQRGLPETILKKGDEWLEKTFERLLRRTQN